MVDHPSRAGHPGLSRGEDTIAAIATPLSRGALGIVRVSGPLVPAIAQAVLGRLPSPRVATTARFCGSGQEVLDHGVALYFPQPASFTGEDVLELQGHGSPVVLNDILDFVCRLGARRARAGEFSERAFLNGKLDLAQAEAVADLIDSGSRRAARAALRSLQGVFSDAVTRVTERLIALRREIEARIDFSDDEVGDLDAAVVETEIERLIAELQALEQEARAGRRLRDGYQVALLGAPNSGKSSLLNALAGDDAAIVSPREGTTRDLLRVPIEVDGASIELVDTAGYRLTEDEVEAEGVRRAQKAAAQADLALLLIDDHDPRPAPPATGPYWEIRTKIDLTGRAAGGSCDTGKFALSAVTGAGLEGLRKALALWSEGGAGEGTFSARARHVEALARARQVLESARLEGAVRRGPELVAEDLRRSQQALDEITGRFTSDELLGRIFASFCIGK